MFEKYGYLIKAVERLKIFLIVVITITFILLLALILTGAEKYSIIETIHKNYYLFFTLVGSSMLLISIPDKADMKMFLLGKMIKKIKTKSKYKNKYYNYIFEEIKKI